MKYSLILLSVLAITISTLEFQTADDCLYAYAALPEQESEEKLAESKPKREEKLPKSQPKEESEGNSKSEEDQKEKKIKIVGAFVPVDDIHAYVSDPQNKPILELAREEAKKLVDQKYRFSRYEEILEQVVAGKNIKVIMKYKNIYLRHHKAKHIFVQIFQGLGDVKPEVTKSYILY